MPEDKQYKQIDKFDRVLGALKGLPDVACSQPATKVITSPLIGEAQTFVIQTMRQREAGDTIFIQYMDAAGSFRMVLPPEAADAIARQRDALTTKVRKGIAKHQAQLRKAAGIQPGFMKGKKPAKKP